MKHIQGRKMSSQHTSVIEVALPIVKAARALPCVSKVVTGIIKQLKGHPVVKSLKITEIPAGLQLKVRGPKSVQELFIYTSDRISTFREIEKVFHN